MTAAGLGRTLTSVQNAFEAVPPHVLHTEPNDTCRAAVVGANSKDETWLKRAAAWLQGGRPGYKGAGLVIRGPGQPGFKGAGLGRDFDLISECVERNQVSRPSASNSSLTSVSL